MSGKREVVPLQEGQTKTIRKVTQSRLGNVIEEVVVVEEHKCANGKITVTTTTTKTTKQVPDVVEVQKIEEKKEEEDDDDEKYLSSEEHDDSEQKPTTETPVTTTATATATEETTTTAATVVTAVAEAPAEVAAVSTTTTTETTVVENVVAATTAVETPAVTTTVTETVVIQAAAVPEPAVEASVVTTTVTETVAVENTTTETTTSEETTTEETTTEETTEETTEPEKEQPPYFEISASRGKKRALLVGINYYNTPSQLSGCISDVLKMKTFLMNFHGFRESDILLLTDDTKDPFLMPTNHNIRKAMAEMCRDSQLNDSFFFHFSGHGGNEDDYNGDEIDGKDETICPCDYENSGDIIDDDMYDLMVRPLCEGSRLTAVFDSCHSGTALDLPYVYSSEGDIKSKSLIRQAGEGILGISTNHKGGALNLISSFMGLGQDMIKTRQIEAHQRELNTSPADVIMFSGCDDHEYSRVATVSNESIGAVSYAFIRALTENPDQTYLELLKNIRKMTVLKYDQTPQLSTSHPIDLNQRFFC
ncbi:caspase domain-containing protein [Phycomyces nitens]|nr:caspase domain-containing protein [Phycomyces nitens]